MTPVIVKVKLKPKASFLKWMVIFYDKELDAIYHRQSDKYTIYLIGKKGKRYEALVDRESLIFIGDTDEI